MNEAQRYKAILDTLAKTYPDAKPGLHFSSPFELLIATILSAQCTDKRVNQVTQVLFRDYPDAQAIAQMPANVLEDYIHSCGVYKNKARNILATCKILVEQYGGQVPKTMEELTKLPGVGRKTANVVMSNAFGIDAIAVDTHVFRVSNRLGLAHAANVEKTEEDLMRNIPKEQWSIAHHWIITHGRQICSARKPKCDQCPLQAECEYYSAAQKAG
ncbi:endonuclease III [Luoshenia tenuis]|jgi:endonuclease-3|uniref:endonuclease III n=1 Tax=Luoshenia tenuis TaxID=2763654 RepID=UPI003D92812B